MKQYDAIIIGFGKAGKTLAVELAKKDWSVALIERSPEMYGGSCINIACVPTKRLAQESKISALAGLGDKQEQKMLYKSAVERKNELVTLLRGKNVEEINSYPNITLFTGEASFETANSVVVKQSDGEITLQGRETFINTGSECIEPAINGLADSKHAYTTASLLSEESLPENLIIIGGGAAGLEFASIYTNFGSKVTLIETEKQFMPTCDRDVAGCVESSFEKRGITIILNSQVISVTDKENGVIVKFIDRNADTERVVEGNAVLSVVGRKPSTASLNLKKIGVEIDGKGAIVTNNHLRTTIDHVWAMGDVRGGRMSTALAIDDCRIIMDKLFGADVRGTDDRVPTPFAWYTDPPFAHIGITEMEAIKQGYNFKVSRLLVAAVTRSHTLNQTEGMMKAIINSDTNKIIGCTLFCADAPEIINTVNVAMKLEQPYSFLENFIFTHPSMSEAFNQLFAVE